MKLYRVYMQARDRHIKANKAGWRAAMRAEEGKAMSTRKRKAARRHFRLR